MTEFRLAAGVLTVPKVTAPRVLALAVAAMALQSTLANAETVALRCVYTETTYDASFMKQPEKRDCPEPLCYYDIVFDSSGGLGSVHGSGGHQVQVTDQSYTLTRSTRNHIVPGIDTAFFTIDRQSLQFKSKKTTPPDVSVSAEGGCSPLP